MRFYIPAVQTPLGGVRYLHKIMKRASEAQEYAARVVARWRRLYNGSKHD